MEALTLLLFVGALWVALGVGLFCFTVLSRSHEHADRLAILPLEDNWHDAPASSSSSPDTPPPSSADNGHPRTTVARTKPHQRG